MSRAIVWGTGVAAILVAALFIPFDIFSDDGSAPAESERAAPRVVTAKKTSSPRRSISAALTESASDAQQREVTTDTVTRTQPAIPANKPTDSPATLPKNAAPPLFANQRVLAYAAPRATQPTIRAIQRELSRHGCYNGAIDGDWGPASRYAAATFTRAVNAALPLEQPDAALLALARRHPGPACTSAESIGVTTAATSATIGATAISAGQNSSSYTAAAPRPLTGAPRIVRSGGAPAIATVVPTSPAGALPNRMALGVDLPPGSPSAAPVTQASPPAAASRNRAQNRDRQFRRRARSNRNWRKRSRRWRQKVYNPIDLSGS